MFFAKCKLTARADARLNASRNAEPTSEAETRAAATVKAVAVNFRRAFVPATLDPGEPESDRGAQKDFMTRRGGGVGGGEL